MKPTNIPLVVMLAVLAIATAQAQPKGNAQATENKATPSQGNENKVTPAQGNENKATPTAPGGAAKGISTAGTKAAEPGQTPGQKSTPSAKPADPVPPDHSAKGGKAAPNSTPVAAPETESGKTKLLISGAKAEEKAKGPNENASDNAKAVHAVLEKFETQREQYLANRKTLLESLKTASENEKKAILEQLKQDRQAREEEERALAKQIREELKQLREQRKSG